MHTGTLVAVVFVAGACSLTHLDKTTEEVVGIHWWKVRVGWVEFAAAVVVVAGIHIGMAVAVVCAQLVVAAAAAAVVVVVGMQTVNVVVVEAFQVADRYSVVVVHNKDIVHIVDSEPLFSTKRIGD